MADRLVDLNTTELYGLICDYEGYKDNLEQEIDEIDYEILDLTLSEGEGINAFVSALVSIKKDYTNSLVEVNEMIGILTAFHENIKSFTNKNDDIYEFQPMQVGPNHEVITEFPKPIDIGKNIKINEDIIKGELYPKLNELLDSYVLEPSWFQNWVDAKSNEYYGKGSSVLLASGYTYQQSPNGSEYDEFFSIKARHERIKNQSELLKAQIETNTSQIKELGNFVIDIFGELDTLESYAESIGIKEDDFRRYSYGSGNGVDYNFDINNLEAGVKNLLNDETKYSVLVDEIGDGTLNEQINEAWIDVMLNDDYTKLKAIYESLGDYPQYNEYILGRLQEIQYNTAVSISNGIINDYMNKGFDKMEVNSHLYKDSEALYLKSLQLSLFSSEFPNISKDDVYYSINFDTFNTDGMHITGNILVQTMGNDGERNINFDYEFSVEQYSADISNEDNKDYAFEQDKEALKSIFISLAGEVKYIGPVVSEIDSKYSMYSNVYELFSDQEFEELYLKNYGYAFNSKIDSNVYLEPHYALMYMDIVKNEYEDLYYFYQDMNYNIEKYGYKEAAEMDLESKYNMGDILYKMNSAEAYTLSILGTMDVQE